MLRKRKTILIADDEENVRRLVCSMLSEENRVIEAEDGEAAVRKARRYNLTLF